MNKHLLRYKMSEFGDTNATLAAALGITATSLSYKLNESNGTEFKQGEINAIIKRYDLTAEEVNDIFFTTKVS